jgi:single-stranded-DNA-specific exonuclease
MSKPSQLKWICKPTPSESDISTNQNEIGLTKSLAQILAQRSIIGYESAKKFFRISKDQIHSPFLMQDMDLAANRLIEAIELKEKILVYGDYDVDGTTAVALVFSYLKQFTDCIDYYIPDRYAEGYGVSEQGILWAKENDFNLIITLDCGIKANDKITLANKHNIDVIICDHHTPGEQLPDAFAVLDPKRQDCNYPYKELSGCGVGYKLLCAFAELTDQEDPYLMDYLDLLAISIAADIVPITKENRTLCTLGLEKLNTNPSLGLKTLLSGRKKNNPFTVSDLVFFVAPRINAAGRIKSGKHAVALMIEENYAEANELTENIEANNTERKELDKEITAEALSIVEENNKTTELSSTVVYQEHWHKGVIGIVASRLIETYYKPTIVLTKSGDKASGSARSVDGYSVYEAIAACENHLTQFGGHKYAAGLTLPIENIPAFTNAFENYVSNTILPEQKTPTLSIDLKISLEEITFKFYRILKQMEPYGPGNMTPVFLTKQVKGIYAKIVGDNHLKVTITNDQETKISAIGFGLGNWLGHINAGESFDIAFVIEENEWQGNVTLQLNLRDICQ